MTTRRKVRRPLRPTSKATAFLNEEAQAATSRQFASAEAYDRSSVRVFLLSAILISASAIFGTLELAASGVGLLSWIAIAVTAAAWVVGAVGERVRLTGRPTPPVTTVTSTTRHRRQLIAHDLV